MEHSEDTQDTASQGGFLYLRKEKTMLEEGYGIMPNTVLFDKKLTANAKLLFVLISSLCAQKGYCYANNKYLSERLNIKERTVSRLISDLSKYIEIDCPRNQLRQISLAKNVYAPSQKWRSSLAKNGVHNNISSNIINKYSNNGFYCKKHKDNFVPKNKVCGYC
jgi:hypothetical protein